MAGVYIPGTNAPDLVTTEGNYIFKKNGVETDFTDQFVPKKAPNAFLATEFGDEIVTGRGADKICSGGGEDDITSGDGADTIDAGADDDFVDAGKGDDTVRGEGGNDIIFGKAGRDILIGGAGKDYIDGGADADQISGGNGDDEVYGRGGADKIDLGNGDDYAEGGAGADSICGGEGNDEIYGNNGDDLIAGGFGVDKLYGDEGDDDIYGGEQVFGKDSHGNKTYEGDLDTSKDHIEGGAGNDCLVGGGGNDFIDGGDDDDIILGDDVLGVSGLVVEHDTNYGDDTLFGGAGDDRIDGGRGNDKINGGLDNDAIAGSGGNDILTGGGGNDRFIFRQFEKDNAAGDIDVITDFNAGDVIVLWGKDFVPTEVDAIIDVRSGSSAANDALIYLSDGNKIILWDVIGTLLPANFTGVSDNGSTSANEVINAFPAGTFEQVFRTDLSGTGYDDCVIDCDVDCCPEVEDPGAAWVAADSNGGGMGG